MVYWDGVAVALTACARSTCQRLSCRQPAPFLAWPRREFEAASVGARGQTMQVISGAPLIDISGSSSVFNSPSQSFASKFRERVKAAKKGPLKGLRAHF